MQTAQNLEAIQISESDERLNEIILSTRSKSFLVAEELSSDDLQLEFLSEKYRKIGMKYQRRVLAVMHKEYECFLGAIVCYRAPLGLNFSLLENRSEIFLHKDVADNLIPDVIRTLLAKSASLYEDFLLAKRYINCSARACAFLLELGAEVERNYCHAGWLDSSFQDYSRHIENYYRKLDRIMEIKRARKNLRNKSE